MAGFRPKIQNSNSLSSLKTVPAAFTIFIHLPVSPIYTKHSLNIYTHSLNEIHLCPNFKNREIISLAGEVQLPYVGLVSPSHLYNIYLQGAPCEEETWPGQQPPPGRPPSQDSPC